MTSVIVVPSVAALTRFSCGPRAGPDASRIGNMSGARWPLTRTFTLLPRSSEDRASVS